MDPMGLALNLSIPSRPDLQEEGEVEGPQRTRHYVSHSRYIWLVLLGDSTGAAVRGFPPPSLCTRKRERGVSTKRGCGGVSL